MTTYPFGYWLSGTMSRIRVNANHHGRISKFFAQCVLQLCNEFVRVQRDNSIIVVSSQHEHIWVLVHVRAYAVNRRVPGSQTKN